MRVIVNQIEALKQKTGIGHYTDQLLRCLWLHVRSSEVSTYPVGWMERLCRAVLSRKAKVEARSSSNAVMSGIRGRVWQRLRSASRTALAAHFRHVCARGKHDLYHEPNMIPLPVDCPTVATVHDLSLLLHPQWHPAERVRAFERHFQAGVRQCRHFLTVSDCVRQEVIRAVGVPADQVTRVYNGIRPGLRALPCEIVSVSLRKLGLPSQYLLYVGTLEPRKNIHMLLRAYCALPAEVRRKWPLVLVGRWGWNASTLWEYLDREARHRGVLHLGYVSEEQLPVLYSGARALLYPSFYEGFGLPPMEMMACGGAVIASTAAALVETVGSQAQLVPPDDMDGWREAILRVLHDDDWWQFLRSNAELVARPFTWERCAAETVEVYRRLTTPVATPVPGPSQAA